MQAIRHHLKQVMYLCLALAIFSQFAMVAQACATMQAMPSSAFAQTEHRHCHDEENRANPNACLVHCLQGDQVPVSHETVSGMQFAAMPSEISVPSLTATWSSLPSQLLTIALDTGPPIPILYCRFLN